MNTTRTAKRLIERYLKGVDRALTRQEVAERREIVDELRTHIHESLAAEDLRTIRADDVRRVLATMDPPDAYRSEGEDTAPSASVRGQRIGRIGFFFLIAALATAGFAILVGAVFSLDALLRGGLIVAAFLAATGFGLGVAGWRSPLGKAAVVGSVLVLAAALVFLPLGGSRSGPGEPVITRHGPIEAGGDPAETGVEHP